jgi:hypothetical protein
MKTVLAKKVLVRNVILEEESLKIRFRKDGKLFQGALFWTDLEDDVELKVLNQEVIEAESDNELVQKVIAYYLENTEKTYKGTASTMRHWQYVNGFTNTIMRGWEEGYDNEGRDTL